MAQHSWTSVGLVKQAWERLSPPTRDELARRMGVEGSDLSARNTGSRPLTLSYAERIVAAVQQDDDTFTVADLGAPSSVVGAVDPTVLDRLEELAAAVKKLSQQGEDLALVVGAITLRLDETSTRAQPTSRRKRRSA